MAFQHFDAELGQETDEGKQYNAVRKHVLDRLRDGKRLGFDLEAEDELGMQLSELGAENEAILALKELTPGMVHTSDVLTSLSVMYANDEFIGGRLMPTVMTSGKLSGIYYTYDKRDRLSYPDDTAGHKSTLAELNQGRSTGNYSLTPRGLTEWLDMLTLQNEDAPLNELLDIQENVLHGMMFRRELRIAAVIQTSGNYSGNTTAIGAGDRWDVIGSNPGPVVDIAKAAMWRGNGPTKDIMKLSLSVYNTLKRHPAVLDRWSIGNDGVKFASRQMLAAYFDVDEVIVGAPRKDTANEGVSASYSRIWDDTVAIVRVAQRPSIRSASFGYVFQDAPTTSDLFFEANKFTKGGYMQRNSHCDQEKVIAGDTSYLLTTVVG